MGGYYGGGFYYVWVYNEFPCNPSRPSKKKLKYVVGVGGGGGGGTLNYAVLFLDEV